MGLGSGKFQLSVGWRQANATKSYNDSTYNKNFTDLWGPRMRQSVLDVTGRYYINRRLSVLATLPVTMNRFSLLIPPKGPLQGVREGWSVGGIGDLQLHSQATVLDPRDHPYENMIVGLGIKIPTGDWDEQRTIPNLNGNQWAKRAVYPAAVMPGDGGTGIVGTFDAFKTFRAPRILRGQSVFVSGSYLSNPRNTNGTSSIINSAGVPLTPNFLNELTNSVADAYAVQAGVSLKIPGTWNKPSLKGMRARVVGRWEGVRSHDLIGPSGGYRQPGYAMSIGPGLTWAREKDMIMVDVPLTFLRYINAERSAVPGPSNGNTPAAFNESRNLGLVAPVSVSVRYIRSF
ncbi:MAG: hypothetical protein SFV17_22360 [Candidatus Obscuribacter sp.]|nr:hypothetical protein [Candidatus Obscuribacter sp.]